MDTAQNTMTLQPRTYSRGFPGSNQTERNENPVGAAVDDFTAGLLNNFGIGKLIDDLFYNDNSTITDQVTDAAIVLISLPGPGKGGKASEVNIEPTAIDIKIQNAADQAAAKVGEGSGHVYGTKVHTEFGKTKIEGTTSEVSYQNGNVEKYGTAGSVRVDRVVGDINNPTAIYDLKTGGAKVAPRDVTRYQQHVPNNLILKQIKPKP